MTYTIQKPADITYSEVGDASYQVPSNYPAEPVDDANWKPNTDVDCWLITLATKKLSCQPFQIHWWDGGRTIADGGMAEVLAAFPGCVVLSWRHLSDMPDEF